MQVAPAARDGEDERTAQHKPTARPLDKLTGYCPLCTSLRSQNAAGSSSVTGHWMAYDAMQTSIIKVDARAAEQQQMLSNFLEAHYPVAGKLESDMHRKLSYLSLLPNLDLSSPLLGSAVSSVCLAHLGIKAQDQRLVQASQSSYGRVLGSLLQNLQVPTGRAPRAHRDILTSIMLLSLFDNSTPTIQGTTTSWTTHFWGALRYIEAAGPSCIDLTQIYDARMYQNLRMPALMLAIAQRKALVFGRPEWRAQKSSHIYGAGPMDWYPMLSPFPGLLEKADILLEASSSPPSGMEIASLCRRLEGLRKELLDFMELDFAGALHSPITNTNAGVTQIGITDLEAFDFEVEEHCFISSSETFLTFHKFHGGNGQALRCSLSWLACLITECTLLQLMNRFPNLQRLLDLPSTDVERRALQMAKELCRTVWAFSALASVAYGDFLWIFIQAAMNFFEEYGAFKEMGWAQACLIATNMRTERLRRTASPTLCRVRDLATELAQATRYRSRVVAKVHETDASTVVSTFDGGPLALRDPRTAG